MSIGPVVESEHGTRTRLIADSISAWGDRVTTFEVRFVRFVLAEFNTHRVFSRNSASSRAIPFLKQVERVSAEPAMPLVWASEQKGMSGGDEIEDTSEAELIWLAAREAAVEWASRLAEQGVHKSICNRLIEPFMWHTVVVTASSYENFFGLRCDPGAQPEIRIAAEQMRGLFNQSRPTEVDVGEWHLPYVGEEERRQIEEWMDQAGIHASKKKMLVKMSSARCAAVSYLRHADWRSVEQDLGLYNKLSSARPMHDSPMEHPCTPSPANVHLVNVQSQFAAEKAKVLRLPRYGNLIGWHQHRFDLDVEADYQAFS